MPTTNAKFFQVFIQLVQAISPQMDNRTMRENSPNYREH